MNSEISQIKIPSLHPDTVIREEFDDWALLFDPNTGNTYGMNPTTVLIVKSIDGNRTVADIVSTISREFDEIPESINSDVSELIDGLVSAGFVSWKE